MSLSVALQYALSGLTAAQSQIQVISGNVSNAQTAGYSEETLPQTSTSAENGGAGVVTGVVQRVTNAALQASVLAQTTTSSAAATLNDYQEQIQSLIGEVGSGTTIADTLNNFESAMQSVAATPADPSAQAEAVNAGQQLAQQLNSMSSGIQTLRLSADNQIATDVTTLNNALNTIANLNGQITQLQALNQSTASLEDERDQALTQVAQLVGVQSYTQPNGSMVVLTTSGQALVEGSNVQTFSYTPSGNVTASSTLSSLTVSGIDVTSVTTTGEIGALLQLRDTTLPNLTAQLNQFTDNLFNQMSTSNLATTNSGLGATNDANDFFADVDIAAGVDNAATIQVNPDLLSDPSLLDTDADGTPDPSITQNLSENLQSTANFAAAGGLAATTTTLTNYIGQVVSNTANQASAATSNATDQSALLTQLQSQYSSQVGVNLDDELAKLITYQNAYGASAHVISTIQTMFDTLMNA